MGRAAAIGVALAAGIGAAEPITGHVTMGRATTTGRAITTAAPIAAIGAASAAAIGAAAIGEPNRSRLGSKAGAPPGVVLMDAGYGADTSLRSALAGLGLAYVAGVQPHTSVWTRANPSPAVRPWSGRGRPTSRMVRDPDHQPQSVEGLALSLPAEAWEMISWREGSADLLISRFARVVFAPRTGTSIEAFPVTRNGSSSNGS